MTDSRAEFEKWRPVNGYNCMSTDDIAEKYFELGWQACDEAKRPEVGSEEKDCAVCKGQGWYAGYADDKNGNRTNEPIQIQCAYCHATGKQKAKSPPATASGHIGDVTEMVELLDSPEMPEVLSRAYEPRTWELIDSQEKYWKGDHQKAIDCNKNKALNRAKQSIQAIKKKLGGA